MSQQYRVTLSLAYQRAADLVKAKALADGLAEPRTNWTRIKYIYPDSGAAGTIYGTRNPATAGYVMKLDAPDIEETRKSEKEVYSESTTDMYLKSTTNGDLLIIELDD